MGYAVLVATVGAWPRHVDSGLALVDWSLTRSVAHVTALTPTEVVQTGEVLANAILFVPVGLIVAWWWPRAGLLHAAGTALSIALVIETVQALAPLDRTTSIVDVVANTSGGVLGFALARLVEAHSRWRRSVLGGLGIVIGGVLAVLVWGLLTAVS